MKKKRQAEILRIISSNEVETQEMLLNLLKQKGYDVTQATVSRDINELNIEKTVSSNGVNCYAKLFTHYELLNRILDIPYALSFR